MNGSGKSNILRIIAGLDTNYIGKITMSKGYSVGLFEQEPYLEPGKTVKEVVEEGRADVVNLLSDYE